MLLFLDFCTSQILKNSLSTATANPHILSNYFKSRIRSLKHSKFTPKQIWTLNKEGERDKYFKLVYLINLWPSISPIQFMPKNSLWTLFLFFWMSEGISIQYDSMHGDEKSKPSPKSCHMVWAEVEKVEKTR